MNTPRKQWFLFAVYGNYTQDYAEKILAQSLPEGVFIDFFSKSDDEKRFNFLLYDAPYNQQREEHAEQFRHAQTSTNCFFILGDFENPEDPTENYISVMSTLHLLALDPQTNAIIDSPLLNLYTSQEWLTQIGEPLLAGQLNLDGHIVINFITQENNEYWMVTRGMLKFGKPELSLHNLPEELMEQYFNFMSTLASEMILTDYIPEDNKEIVISDQPTGIKATHAGSYEDADFWDNVHIELTPL